MLYERFRASKSREHTILTKHNQSIWRIRYVVDFVCIPGIHVFYKQYLPQSVQKKKILKKQTFFLPKLLSVSFLNVLSQFASWKNIWTEKNSQQIIWFLKSTLRLLSLMLFLLSSRNFMNKKCKTILSFTFNNNKAIQNWWWSFGNHRWYEFSTAKAGHFDRKRSWSWHNWTNV